MLFLLFIFGVPLTLFEVDAFVLLRQIDAQHSNVDALIHKTVPSEKYDKFAAKLGKERQKNAEEKVFEEDQALLQNDSLDITKANTKSNATLQLDHIRNEQKRNENYKPRYKAVETDDEISGMEIPEDEPSLGDLFAMVGRKFVKGPSGPMFRSESEGYLFKPETVQLKNGKSSVYTVHPDSLIVALRELFSSSTLKRYVDKISRKAAVVYRTVENDSQPVAADKTIM